MTTVRILFLLFFCLVEVENAKILVLIPRDARSHFNVFLPIIEVLSSRHHEVTVQAFYDPEIPNVEVLPLKQAKHSSDAKERKSILLSNLKAGPLRELWNRKDRFHKLCELYLQEQSTQALVASRKQYDVVIVDALYAEHIIVVASVLGENIVEVNTGTFYPWKQTAIPTPPSFVPNSFELLTDSMTFWERMQNSFNVLGLYLLNEYVLIPGQQQLLDKYLPNAPTIKEAEKRITLTITNGDPVMDMPRPSMPNEVNCGGMHCKKAKSLPKDLLDFVESSGEEGFIIVSFGSNIKSTFLPEWFPRVLLSAFSRLRQKVIWKFDFDLNDLPANVKIMEWMPQQDLLGHPNARLFITHAGLLSLQEAIYHGVPVIGIPFFADQPGNIARAQQLGIGEHLHFFDVTANEVCRLVNKVLRNQSFYMNVKKYSRILKDEPQRPVDRAIFWIEYLLRHKGAHHLRSAGEDLTFFQYFSLDILTLLLASVIVCSVTLIYLATVILPYIWPLTRRLLSNHA